MIAGICERCEARGINLNIGACMMCSEPGCDQCQSSDVVGAPISRLVCNRCAERLEWPAVAGYYLREGLHWLVVRPGFGCAWVVSCDPAIATRYGTCVEALDAVRIAAKGRARVVQIVERDIPMTEDWRAEALARCADLRESLRQAEGAD